jgi:hypothetical protein
MSGAVPDDASKRSQVPEETAESWRAGSLAGMTPIFSNCQGLRGRGSIVNKTEMTVNTLAF